MIIKEKDNFIGIVIKLLVALSYENVQQQTGKVYDITATKDGEKYCFKCQYDIDAVGEKSMTELVEGTKNGEFDKVVFVTNSSFISSAKKLGDRTGILLWDRNTVDRMAIGIMDSLTEDTVEEEKSGKGFIGVIVGVVVVAAAAAAYFFFIK